MQQWFTGALADPDAVTDRVEEGTYTTLFPGDGATVPAVEAFMCTVAP
jgi:hypothetical protein